MAWLNSDDMYYPWTFRTVSSIMTQLPQIQWLTSLSKGFWDYDGFCLGFKVIPGYSRQAFFDGAYLPSYNHTFYGWIQQESSFWHRSLWEKAGSQVDTQYQLAADFDLWSRFFRYEQLYGTPSPLGGFRSQYNQKSRDKNKYGEEAKHSLAETREKLNWSNQARSRILQLKLHRLPKIKNFFKPYYEYVGKKVVKAEPDSPNSQWQILEYSFF